APLMSLRFAGYSMIISEYTVLASINQDITIALIADLHDRPFEPIKQAFSHCKPDIIAIPGDLINGSTTDSVNGLAFLQYAASIAPTFYSLGNHEWRFDADDILAICKTGAIPLDNAAVQFKDINIGGLSTGFRGVIAQGNLKKTPMPDTRWLDEFSRIKGYKLLLSHHPEYYDEYIKPLPIALTLAGHAHGGQIRLFGRGLFAPGQGVFPKYTSGVYDNRLVVSRGLSNTAKLIPRLWNSPELVYITLQGRR
ncbi:MAG TPA: metallophosphoesterase, partial [Bacillota bacterium]|nr:metallophosphoesterase [Bacillota bacterium]